MLAALITGAIRQFRISDASFRELAQDADVIDQRIAVFDDAPDRVGVVDIAVDDGTALLLPQLCFAAVANQQHGVKIVGYKGVDQVTADEPGGAEQTDAFR